MTQKQSKKNRPKTKQQPEKKKNQYEMKTSRVR